MKRLFALLWVFCMAGCGSGGALNLAVENSVPLPPADFSTCVTFIGDSITENWPMENLMAYDGGCYIDHGKGGATMLQILDAIDNPNADFNGTVDPAVSQVAVIGGDIYNSLNRGYSLAQIEGWYAATFEKLRRLGVRTVVCTTLPSGNATFNVQVLELNAWIRAKSSQVPVADIYNTPLVLADGSPNPVYYRTDLIHPLTSSYTLLTGIVETEIAKVRKPKA